MFDLRAATAEDRAYWFTLDKHMRESEYAPKIRDRRCYILTVADRSVGILRYNLFWDEHPFLTLIYLEEEFQRKGYGRQAMLQWEAEMRALGYPLLMTSTQSDEQAQHFYRALGYRDVGCLLQDTLSPAYPMEILLAKSL